MEKKIFGIKAIDTKDKEDVTIVAILVILFGLPLIGSIFSGGTATAEPVSNEKYYKSVVWAPTSDTIPQYTPTSNNEKIASILSSIDPGLRGHISSILIVDNGYLKLYCNGKSFPNYAGCMKIVTYGPDFLANTYVINDYDNMCNTFENTVYHEIGHVDEYYKYGNNKFSEDYADNFASQYTNKKC